MDKDGLGGGDGDPTGIKLRGRESIFMHQEKATHTYPKRGGKRDLPFSCETNKHSCYPPHAQLKRNHSKIKNNNKSKDSNSNNNNSSQPFAVPRHPPPRAGEGRIALAAWFEFDLNHFEYV